MALKEILNLKIDEISLFDSLFFPEPMAYNGMSNGRIV